MTQYTFRGLITPIEEETAPILLELGQPRKDEKSDQVLNLSTRAPKPHSSLATQNEETTLMDAWKQNESEQQRPSVIAYAACPARPFAQIGVEPPSPSFPSTGSAFVRVIPRRLISHQLQFPTPQGTSWIIGEAAPAPVGQLVSPGDAPDSTVTGRKRTLDEHDFKVPGSMKRVKGSDNKGRGADNKGRGKR